MARQKVPPTQALTLTINGEAVTAKPGQTIMDVASEAGVTIPHLCYLDGLSIWGACRLCVVELEGQSRLFSACSTEVAEGMAVQTETPRLRHYRKVIVEMLFAERNHICSVCVSNGHCELQSMAHQLGVDHVHLPYRHPDLSVDSSHERFRLDHNRCILCTRCVRVCGEIEGAFTKGMAGRGIEAMIINDLSEPWGESDTCTSCGKCVHVCPTGALVEKGSAAAEMEKRSAFLPYLTVMREEDSNHS
ncbi:MAG: bidirectional hydrogenase complex protein HoxU [Planctomycetota bacterium]